jgi:putative CRISPR-associated protein (TIGR02619 family)
MQTIITTIGTSLITNQGWRRGQPLPSAAVMDAWLRDTDLKRASAETHTWVKLGLLDEPERHRLLLIHTNSADGRCCAERLKAWAESRGLTCDTEEITGLGTTDEARFNLGLAELAWKLARCIRSGEGAEIAATGGFKPETAVANLVGALLGARVHYVYEGFERLVTLEPLPIAFDLAGLREGPGATLFQTFAAARGQEGGNKEPLLRRAAIDSLLRADPRLELYLETAEMDGAEFAGLNAIGLIVRDLLEAPAVEWPPTWDVLPEKKIRLSDLPHHRPRGWETIVNKLARNLYVTSIRYEAGRIGAQNRLEAALGSDTEVGVLIADGTAPPLGLIVSTTARSTAERELVLRHLKTTLKL